MRGAGAWLLAGITLACSPPSQDAAGGAPSEPAVATVSGEAISSLDLRFPPGAPDEVRKRALEGAILRQETLEPLRAELNRALGETWEEWDIPREAVADWPPAAKKAHAD